MTSLWTHRQENPAALFVDLRAKRTDVDLWVLMPHAETKAGFECQHIVLMKMNIEASLIWALNTSLAKICWSFVCLLVQEDMLDGEDASDMEDFSEEAVQGWNCKVWSKEHTFSHDSQIPILLLVCVGIFQNLVWKRELVDLPFQLVTRGLVRSMG